MYCFNLGCLGLMQRCLFHPAYIYTTHFHTHLTPLTSHLSPLTSHLLPLTSHRSPHTPVCCFNFRVLGAPDSLSTFENSDLMRNLLLFSRFSRDNTSVDCDSMKDRMDQLRAFLPIQGDSKYGETIKPKKRSSKPSNESCRASQAARSRVTSI
jgi:hypothetical protein